MPDAYGRYNATPRPRFKSGGGIMAGLRQMRDWNRMHGSGLANSEYRIGGALDRAGGSADRAESAYLDRALAYDPQASFERTAGAAYNRFAQKLKTDVRDLRGREVGAGRLDSGFAEGDEKDLIAHGFEGFSNILAGHALDTEGLRLNAQGQLGQYADAASNRYLGLLGNRYEQQMLDKRAQDQKGGFFGKALGFAAGAIGGPILGKVGQTIAGKIKF